MRGLIETDVGLLHRCVYLDMPNVYFYVCVLLGNAGCLFGIHPEACTLVLY